MNKKKIILISSITLILIIAIICVVIFGKDKNTSEDNNETTSKVTEVTSTETVTETNSETETESSSEVETTTEEITTQESTTQETTTADVTTEETTTQEETTVNSKFKYKEDIQTVADAIEYFRNLGYNVSDPVTASEIREIYKDFPNVTTSQELEDALALDAGITLVVFAQKTLPTDPNNSKFKYKEDINTIEDTHEYFESLGYKLSTPVTKDELMVIYNDFKSVINPKEIDEAMEMDLEFALSGIAWATLPSNPSKPDKQQSTTGSSNVVIDSYYKPEVETVWQPQTSNKEEETTSNFWDVDYDVPDDIFDGLTSEDNIFD